MATIARNGVPRATRDLRSRYGRNTSISSLPYFSFRSDNSFSFSYSFNVTLFPSFFHSIFSLSLSLSPSLSPAFFFFFSSLLCQRQELDRRANEHIVPRLLASATRYVQKWISLFDRVNRSKAFKGSGYSTRSGMIDSHEPDRRKIDERSMNYRR